MLKASLKLDAQSSSERFCKLLVDQPAVLEVSFSEASELPVLFTDSLLGPIFGPVPLPDGDGRALNISHQGDA